MQTVMMILLMTRLLEESHSDSVSGKPHPSTPVTLLNHLSGPASSFCFSEQSLKSHLQSVEHKLTKEQVE